MLLFVAKSRFLFIYDDLWLLFFIYYKKNEEKKQSFNWTVQLVLELHYTRIFELPCTEYKCFARRFVLDIVIYRSFHHIKHVQIEGIYFKNVYTWLIQYIILVSTVRGCFVFILFPSSQIEIENTYSHICNIIMNYTFFGFDN